MALRRTSHGLGVHAKPGAAAQRRGTIVADGLPAFKPPAAPLRFMSPKATLTGAVEGDRIKS